MKNKIRKSIEEKIAKLSPNICPSSLQNKSVKEVLNNFYHKTYLLCHDACFKLSTSLAKSKWKVFGSLIITSL